MDKENVENVQERRVHFSAKAPAPDHDGTAQSEDMRSLLHGLPTGNRSTDSSDQTASPSAISGLFGEAGKAPDGDGTAQSEDMRSLLHGLSTSTGNRSTDSDHTASQSAISGLFGEARNTNNQPRDADTSQSPPHEPNRKQRRLSSPSFESSFGNDTSNIANQTIDSLSTIKSSSFISGKGDNDGDSDGEILEDSGDKKPAAKLLDDGSEEKGDNNGFGHYDNNSEEKGDNNGFGHNDNGFGHNDNGFGHHSQGSEESDGEILDDSADKKPATKSSVDGSVDGEISEDGTNMKPAARTNSKASKPLDDDSIEDGEIVEDGANTKPAAKTTSNNSNASNHSPHGVSNLSNTTGHAQSPTTVSASTVTNVASTGPSTAEKKKALDEEQAEKQNQIWCQKQKVKQLEHAVKHLLSLRRSDWTEEAKQQQLTKLQGQLEEAKKVLGELTCYQGFTEFGIAKTHKNSIRNYIPNNLPAPISDNLANDSGYIQMNHATVAVCRTNGLNCVKDACNMAIGVSDYLSIPEMKAAIGAPHEPTEKRVGMAARALEKVDKARYGLSPIGGPAFDHKITTRKSELRKAMKDQFPIEDELKAAVSKRLKEEFSPPIDSFWKLIHLSHGIYVVAVDVKKVEGGFVGHCVAYHAGLGVFLDGAFKEAWLVDKSDLLKTSDQVDVGIREELGYIRLISVHRVLVKLNDVEDGEVPHFLGLENGRGRQNNKKPTTTTRGPATTVDPAEFTEKFIGDFDVGKTQQALRRGTELKLTFPLSARGVGFCLKWHLCGKCKRKDKCRGAETHRLLTVDEHSSLLAWCQQCFVNEV